jgi:murein DD-endopeptidase MepM/ murein hydrolase activator NlpD
MAWALHSTPAHAASATQLQQQIGAGQNKISGLAASVSSATGRLNQLGSSIAKLQSQISVIQRDLNAKRAKLLKLQAELNSARARLAHLVAYEAHAESTLSSQLVNSYESDQPDLVTVALDSHGFSDLLERVTFAKQIQQHDAQVVGQVRSARRAVAVQATQLGALEVRQRALTTQVLVQRNNLARVRLSLVEQQIAVSRQRDANAGALAQAKSQVATLQSKLAKILATRAGVSPGQISSGGGFTFPLPKGAASSPGTWTLDQGVDIAAPGGTALLAVGSGTIVLHGIGGFGPSAPVLHLDSGQYVYYGHAGPGNMLPIGTHVSAGQVISEVGSGVVGISSGPHLEIGFCDGSGTPTGGTAPQMMALLRGSY